jgi:UDP-N-acetyl-D-glucosamine dehydrogenase
MNEYQILNNKIKKNNFSVCVIGLGYVGLPLSLHFSKKTRVIGVDIDKNKIDNLKKNISYIDRISNQQIRSSKNNFYATDSFEVVNNSDVIVIAVPTPLKNDNPDLSFIKKTILEIREFLKPGQLLILESTSYPTTTRNEIVDKLKNNFQVGKNFFISFSSERINPGFNENRIHLVPKVVSGYSKNCANISSLFYSKFFKKIVTASSLEIAEFSKIQENIYRAVNIALVNEMKTLADKMNINFFDVLDIAETKPYGFQKFYPGPGIGGHCIPIDPIYLAWLAKKYNVKTEFIKLSVKVNNDTTNKIIKNSILFLKKLKKEKTKVLVLGLSYKKNIDDLRESPSLKIIKGLKSNKINVFFSDPYFDKIPKTRDFRLNIKKIDINYSSLKDIDLVILVTDHDKFNYKKILRFSKKIIDCRNAFPFIHEKILKLR